MSHTACACGNCFYGSLIFSVELPLLALLIFLMILTKFPLNAAQQPYWFTAALGVLITPSFVGIPLFIWAYAKLLAPVLAPYCPAAITHNRP